MLAKPFVRNGVTRGVNSDGNAGATDGRAANPMRSMSAAGFGGMRPDKPRSPASCRAGGMRMDFAARVPVPVGVNQMVRRNCPVVQNLGRRQLATNRPASEHSGGRQYLQVAQIAWR